MTKPEALDKIIKAGYCASLESNVIMADLPDANALEGFRNKLKEIGYDASFGFRIQISSDSLDLRKRTSGEKALESEELVTNVAESAMPKLYHIGADGQMQFI